MSRLHRKTAPRSLEIRKAGETRQAGGILELKDVGEKGEFEGHGSVFNNEDSYGDVVVPGAFQKSLEEHRQAGTLPAMLWQHDPAQPIGTYSEMREDAKGLYVKGQLLLDIPQARAVHAMLKARAIRGLSIGFVTRGWEWKEDVRIVKDVDLWEVSLVTFPANKAAGVDDVKNSHAIPETERELEAYLREVGKMSKSEAKACVSGIRASILERRDASDELGKTLGAATRLLKTLEG